MSNCICDTTTRSACTYHGALHAPARATLRRIWPASAPEPEAIPLPNLARNMVGIQVSRWKELQDAERRLQAALILIKRARQFSPAGTLTADHLDAALEAAGK